MTAGRWMPTLACLVLLVSCRANEDRRRSVLESAERANDSIARGALVRELRAPSESTRIIYAAPINLSRTTAMPAGAEQVWAPFGIATPDTLPKTTYR